MGKKCCVEFRKSINENSRVGFNIPLLRPKSWLSVKRPTIWGQVRKTHLWGVFCELVRPAKAGMHSGSQTRLGKGPHTFRCSPIPPQDF